ICFGNADAIIVVADATCLERNLNLVYQIMELTPNVVLCINLIDEAKKKKIEIDADGLGKELGISIVLCAARSGIGIMELKRSIHEVVTKKVKPCPNIVIYDEYEETLNRLSIILDEYFKNINPRWVALRMIDGDDKLIISLKELMPNEKINAVNHILEDSKLNMDKQTVRDI